MKILYTFEIKNKKWVAVRLKNSAHIMPESEFKRIVKKLNCKE